MRTSLRRGARACFPGIALVLALAAGVRSQAAPGADASGAAAPPAPVSFRREVAPLLLANCAGCHQPAKAGGRLVVTDRASLSKTARDGSAIVAAGDPDASLLLKLVLPSDGKAPKMPKGRPPLREQEIGILRRWIQEGARDDSPASPAAEYSQERPPVYRHPPVVTALGFSPDGKLLAVSGHHEVLLYEIDAAGTGVALAARLVGMSDRIQSAAFSPDGTRILVAGGKPARFGEIQIWDAAAKALRLSLPIGTDTLYGASWSDDGRLLAFGGGDNSVRALDAASGEPVFFSAASEDLVLDTAFSKDGAYIVSVGRDRALKLFQIATQQFIDNVTSITPGVQKGGLMAVDRKPDAEVLLAGGADGTPRTYNMHRTKERKIGDDFNLVKAYAPMPGRIYAVEWAADSARFLAASSSGTQGELRAYETDKEPPAWSLATSSGLFAATFRPAAAGRALIAAGGSDGIVTLVDASSGEVVHTFPAGMVPARPAPEAPASGEGSGQ